MEDIYTHMKTTYACTLHKHSTYIWFIYLCMLYIHVRVYVYRNSMCIYMHSYIKGKSHYSLHIQSLYFYPWLAEDKLSLIAFLLKEWAIPTLDILWQNPSCFQDFSQTPFKSHHVW